MRFFPNPLRLSANRSASAKTRDTAPSSPHTDFASRSRRKRIALALSIAVATLADAGCVATVPPPPSPPIDAVPFATAELPPQCVVSYVALLDLAELARRYGRASSVFLDALGDLSDQLNNCLKQADDARTPGRLPESPMLHAIAVPLPGFAR
ncbi:hypothetical protein N0A02_25940 [Paraburkholderia acidicola]|uniref:Uncharacterized protein n=1 Tax=Paraburkholderia acidicola TaxID=1912599 RepID=A0ABV1LUG4_9BURK